MGMVNGELSVIEKKLASFRRKYYLNLFIRGALLSLTILLAYFLLASLLEYNLWLGRWARLFIVLSFIGVVGYCIYHFLREPIAWWIYKKGLAKEESARMIGAFFPTVKDKLLNLIQLSSIQTSNPMVVAGMSQKARTIEHISFETAIDLRENRRLLRYLMIPFLFILVIFLLNRNIITQSTKRIVLFNQEFSPEAPFQFIIEGAELEAFLNEDFVLNVAVQGHALPTAVYIQSGTQRYKMESTSAETFSYTFEKLQNELTFQLEGSGFYSKPYKIHLLNRPELTQLKINLEYPRYLRKTRDELINTGNLEIPEGTKVTWHIATMNASGAFIGFSSKEEEIPMQQVDDQSFTLGASFHSPDHYWISLDNEHSRNKDQIAYGIQVVKDQFPQIVVDNLRDSILFERILLGGTVQDDYGITDLKLHYEIVRHNKPEKPITQPITIQPDQRQQSFFYQWPLDSLSLKPGDQINYYLEVWDNDGVNGHKSTRSGSYVLALPSVEEMKADITKSHEETENKIDQGLKRAKSLRESIDEAQQKLRGKQNLEWQDKKMLEDLVEKRANLDQLINELQKQNELLNQKKDNFSEQDERIREKSEQIQKLMDELLDDETKKLFEELEKLLKENTDVSQIQKMLDKMDRKGQNLEKELERTLELFKQYKYDYKLDQSIQEIEEQEKRQSELLEQTEKLAGKEKPANNSSKQDNQTDKNPDQESSEGTQNDKNKSESVDNQSLAKDQEELRKSLDEFKNTLEELNQLGEELNKDTQTPAEEELQDLSNSEEKSQESLQEGKPDESVAPQKSALQQMKAMKQQLQGMQNSMEMEMDVENLESLRQIIHGLIKLSYDQENIMSAFSQIQQTDPKYVSLGQAQLKLKDDSKVLEDSLLSLAKRDPFMGSIVTREIGELNDHVDKAVENIRERRKGNAGAEMQFSMTSINNLALMLNDHFDMMMNMMANAKPSSGKGKKGKSQPSLGQMQQELNQRIEELKNGGKSGRQLSEELARLAAEQERIRRALQQMQEKLEQEGGKAPGGDLPGQMEQTEMELVNKRITEQTIRRQQQILTRLLEAEKSMREQNMDNERKGETAKDYQKDFPRAFEEYLRLKEKEVELLKTVPPKLYPYYKKEVNDYFHRIENFD